MNKTVAMITNNLAAGPKLTDKMPYYLRRRRSQKVNISFGRGGREGEMEIWMAQGINRT